LGFFKPRNFYSREWKIPRKRWKKSFLTEYISPRPPSSLHSQSFSSLCIWSTNKIIAELFSYTGKIYEKTLKVNLHAKLGKIRELANAINNAFKSPFASYPNT
jgi:hypothetical protein